jgi:hypothetical protein
MKKGRWVWLLALTWLAGGCCAHPGVFQRVHQSLKTVQEFYDPLLKDGWELNDTARRAVVAADTTLLLAGELQRQWCPDPSKAEQLELQAKAAQELAQQAGVAGK